MWCKAAAAVGVDAPQSKKTKKSQAEPLRTTENELEDGHDSDDDIDQAGALLKGFDSDSEDPAEDEGFDKDKPTAALPNYKKTQKKLRQAAQKGTKDGPGAVYVGRIPHGFYENEMRQYFSQFGTITKLRLSRNRKTGQSKHFAFLEFESNEVAKIVAETMDNYLMFGHILKCKYVQPEALHPDTFKGANKRFRVAPHNKMEKRALEAPKSESQWAKKNSKEQSKREKKAEKLKAMGYEIDLPKLKDPSEVLEGKSQKPTAEKEADSTIAETKEGPIETTTDKPEAASGKKKAKKEKREKQDVADTSGATVPATDPSAQLSGADQSQLGSGQKTERRDKRKEKPEKAKEADTPAKAGAEATMKNLESVKASQGQKEKKKEKSGARQATIDERVSSAKAKAGTAALENNAPPSTLPAGGVEEDKTKKSSKKRKSSVAGKEAARSETVSTDPSATNAKKEMANGEAAAKSTMRKKKKARMARVGG